MTLYVLHAFTPMALSATTFLICSASAATWFAFDSTSFKYIENITINIANLLGFKKL